MKFLDKDQINTILNYVLIILLVLQIRSCVESDPEPVTHRETIVETEYVQGKTDTIVKYKEIVVEKPIYIKVPKYITDPVTKDTTSIVYDNPYEDTLLKGNIISHIQPDGTLTKQDLLYTPKFPKIIRRTDTLKINTTTTETIIKNSSGIYLGATAYGNQSYLGIAPTLTLKTKKDRLYSLGYDPFNKTVTAEMSFKLFTLKK